MTTIDVVVPCYNYGRFLERCVASLLGQEDVTVRVLVIDDASTDDTPRVGAALATRDPRVTFRRHETNAGHIATYNEGLLEWANAEYSLLISADDVVAPGALARATRLLSLHPEVGMAYGMAQVIENDADPPAVPPPAVEETRVIPGERFLRHCCERAYCPVSTPTAVVRTSMQHACGGYSADLPHSGDLEMWMRFALRGPIGVLRSVQAFYRWHAANMGARYYNQLLGDRHEFLLACQRVLGGPGEHPADAATWLVTMHRTVAVEAIRSANRCFDLGDDAGARAWLTFAHENDPGVRGSRGWWRLQVTRVLGRPMTGRIRAIRHRLRGLPPEDGSRTDPTHFRGFRPGGSVGWWPESSG
jgi:glycosyltransferase involved in cell wall biosynthesis